MSNTKAPNERRDDSTVGKTVRQHAGVALAMLSAVSGITPQQAVEELCTTCDGFGEINEKTKYRRDCDIELVGPCPTCDGTGIKGE